MPTHKPLHQFKASSASAWILAETPKEVRLHFLLQSGDFLAVEIPRHVLARLVRSAQRAIDAAPVPFRGLSKASRPATSRSR